MKLGLEGRSVLITGASKGIGLAAARSFAAEGCSLYLASRSADQLEANRASIVKEHGVKVDIYPCDLSQTAAVESLAKKFGHADILINNAGAIPSGDLWAVTDAHWRESWDVKVYGYVHLTRLIYPLMKERRSGVIINDIGNSGENWDAAYIAGVTANAGLMAFTRALGGVSFDFGVRVVGVNPGPVATDRMVKLMKRRAFELWNDESRWQELHDKYPGKRPATPEEVADLMVFLASPKAGYITGTIVTIDGGIASRRSII